MAGKICVYIRDSQQLADLYDSGTNWFAISIREVGSNGPLHWKGINYNWVQLQFRGEFSLVAGEYEVPAGTYLVTGYSWCRNVVTQVAWVQVNDGETVSVNLVPTSVQFCLQAAMLGVALGTVRVGGREIPITQIAPAEVAAFQEVVRNLMARLPREIGMPTTLIEVEELRKRFAETSSV